jgi:glycosyltransferase involved in cell wall biosynthesis
MKILIVTQYFYPEPGATTNRILSFAREFVKKGHDITVLCEFPSYPTGVLPKQYRYKFLAREKFENFTIVRSFIISTARTNLFTRLASYLSFASSSFIIALTLKKPDIIIALSPPPTVGFIAALTSKIKSVPMIGDIQDLWPEYAIATGHLRNRFAISLARFIEHFFYNNCTAMVTISKGVRAYLENITKGKKPIHIIYNGSSVPDLPDFNNIRTQPFTKPNINICYAGVIGILQPIEDLVAAAELTRDDKSISYNIIGDGVRQEELANLAKQKGLENIKFWGALSQAETNTKLQMADIGIVTLLDIEQFKSAIPSKFFDYMAIGLPVILGVDGEAREILESHKTGLFYQSGCPDELVKQVRYLQANPGTAREMGLSGRELVISKFRRSQQSAEMEKIISEFEKR